MSDRFYPLGIERLFRIIENEEKRHNTVLGIAKSLFFTPSANDPFRMERYGVTLETPIGVAAGPNSQMAQNIIAAWLCGARYIELKTVQTLDEIHVSKPCIDIQDEGYNCEWSQELRILESIHEYVNAWVLIHVLHHKYGFEGKPGFIFNMSVGYNMEGILNANVQEFFDKMYDASELIKERVAALESYYPAIKDIVIPSRISDNITLSTMHGCPPDEIEKIGLYLIKEKKLHTTIKCNPTLLGPEMLRKILNDKLGFTTEVPDVAFEHDLKYPDAINLINSLTNAAAETGVEFGLKLTNTLESMNNRDVFNESEKMMYMSGRALHPISIHLAEKLQKEFNGKLDISFCAGGDCYNISDIIACGLSPLTVCSDILKPGGYGRIAQYVSNLRNAYTTLNAVSPDDYMFKKSGENEIAGAKIKNLTNYAPLTLENENYRKNIYKIPDIKTNRTLNAFDCIAAPCVTTCPSNQEIPQYMYHAAKGEIDKAIDVILRTNPFPNVCGMVCDHPCQGKCTRVNYDNPLLIRDVKRFIANSNTFAAKTTVALNNSKVAVIGAGPSGLACAYFLANAGFTVKVYETKDIPGGMVADAIPAFRLSAEAIRKDIEAIKALGVEINYNHKIDSARFSELKNNNDYIYIAVGAQKARRLEIEGENLESVLDPLAFLSDILRKRDVKVGKRVAVIGGGNTAMDVSRTCRRILGKDGEITLVYRRTRTEMPADAEEIQGTLNDSVNLYELTAPLKITANTDGSLNLHCIKMQLSEKDESGRRKPVAIPGSEFVLNFDTIIPAAGQQAVLDFIEEKLNVNKETFATNIQGVYMGGDAFRGGATIIRAIGDGRKVAEQIVNSANIKGSIATVDNKDISLEDLMVRRSVRIKGKTVHELPFDDNNRFRLITKGLDKNEAMEEASRCLYCDELCNICVTVCPNRANYMYKVNPVQIPLYLLAKSADGNLNTQKTGDYSVNQKYQIVNIGDFCNECGNCSTFCPSAGRPYRDKPHFYLNENSFAESDSGYQFVRNNNLLTLLCKENGDTAKLTFADNNWIYEDNKAKITLDTSYKMLSAEMKADKTDTTQMASMIVLFSGMKDELSY